MRWRPPNGGVLPKQEMEMLNGCAFGMTEEEYYAEIRRMGLLPTSIPTVYMRGQEVRNVPLAKDLSPRLRLEVVERIRKSFEF
ncbi:hypothetical protein Ga0061061_1103 [Chelatococcus sambhunathii]|uniref:Uncharacterized protein n=1 Tax=Chelatococcus sambhunathii TaxID=363953 RepID=A0ABP2A744_9HYPH|nr:hypothetical protein Ga0061061_1103 [Chelatococcus sambhunathii]